MASIMAARAWGHAEDVCAVVGRGSNGVDCWAGTVGVLTWRRAGGLGHARHGDLGRRGRRMGVVWLQKHGADRRGGEQVESRWRAGEEQSHRWTKESAAGLANAKRA